MEYLANSKNALQTLKEYKKVRVVLGNETCDLDSAVCTLVQALYEYLDLKEQNENDIAVIPLLNVPQDEYHIKTEVDYHFGQHNINQQLLIFRDQIDLNSLNSEGKLELILVDHHVLPTPDVPLAKSVIKVIDHRPQDELWLWRDKDVITEMVGSCSTLVARNILQKYRYFVNADIASLLLGPILIDTFNLSEEAKRVTPIDIEVVSALEAINPSLKCRETIFEKLLAAKTDISNLTVDDLMKRDLKITNGVPIVGLPMLVEKFLGLEDSKNAVKRFAEAKQSPVVILIGLDLAKEQVTRDIAIYSNDDELNNKVTEILISSTEPNLELKPVRVIEENKHKLSHYAQGNLRATRKHILPLIKKAVS